MNTLHALKCKLAEEVLRKCGRLHLQATGCSMLPTIWPGDILVVSRIGEGSVVAGDIVLTRSITSSLVAHRVFAMNERSFLTRGDSQKWPDAPVAKDEFLGKVSAIIRRGKIVEPRRSLRASERCVAAFFRRSRFAARVTSRLYRLSNGVEV